MNSPAQPTQHGGQDVYGTGNQLAQSGLIRRGQTSGKKAMGPPMRYPIKLALAAPWPAQPRTQRKINEGDIFFDKHRRLNLGELFMATEKSMSRRISAAILAALIWGALMLLRPLVFNEEIQVSDWVAFLVTTPFMGAIFFMLLATWARKEDR